MKSQDLLDAGLLGRDIPISDIHNRIGDITLQGIKIIYGGLMKKIHLLNDMVIYQHWQ